MLIINYSISIGIVENRLILVNQIKIKIMKTKVYLGIAIRLILLFSLGMAITFVTPHMRGFFGDKLHVHTKMCLNTFSGCTNYHEPDNLWEWGVRHYWYFWLTILLFLLSVANFIMAVVNIIKKNYNTSNW